ncbi:hypothetical protein SAMN05421837_10839 [Amycolatopsis pretoriensis]|uniref:Uncharacterized protein n=1 Tax=Amycolatopsis pretoriensis TaxID=218821 RepID=A0A1H5RCV5_9PSEU|nr:hypothetical protein [Amycolatopsis pretoriensis]SEF35391.1 hypothetical protein SAMN05421837_10839 [Amycolatopsis pretoriensis]
MTSPAPSSRQRWLVPVVVVVLSVTVGAGLLARELYRRPDQPADESTAATSTPPPASSGAQSPAGFVQMSDDAKNHPQAGAVRELLKTYFDAINTKQWSLWLEAVSSKRAASQSSSAWKAGVKSTRDYDALVYRIERGAGGSLRVLVGFTSEQEIADAPEYFPEKCIKWRLVLPVVSERTGLKIDTIDPGPGPEHEKC